MTWGISVAVVTILSQSIRRPAPAGNRPVYGAARSRFPLESLVAQAGRPGAAHVVKRRAPRRGVTPKGQGQAQGQPPGPPRFYDLIDAPFTWRLPCHPASQSRRE